MSTQSRFFAALALFLPLSLPAASPGGARVDSFTSGGKKITVETYGDGEAEDVPSIIVLHGASGLPAGGRFMEKIAEAIAAQGFRVHLVHYFERTGTTRTNDTDIQRHFVAWRETIADAIAWSKKKHPRAPVGVFGYSLGGYLAASLLTQNPQVGAAVVLAGGLDEISARTIRHTPATLILHGSDDTRVKPSEGRALAAALEKAGGSPELHIYPGEHHIMQLPTYVDVVSRSAAFFKKHLGTPAAKN